jgi:hypothetical protein
VSAHHKEKNTFKLSIYAMNGSILGAVKQEKDLGVWIDSDLTWNKQLLNRAQKQTNFWVLSREHVKR